VYFFFLLHHRRSEFLIELTNQFVEVRQAVAYVAGLPERQKHYTPSSCTSYVSTTETIVFYFGGVTYSVSLDELCQQQGFGFPKYIVIEYIEGRTGGAYLSQLFLIWEKIIKVAMCHDEVNPLLRTLVAYR
jgi:hypothetical protein